MVLQDDWGSHIENVTCEQRFEGSERMSHVDLSVKSIPSRGTAGS